MARKTSYSGLDLHYMVPSVLRGRLVFGKGFVASDDLEIWDERELQDCLLNNIPAGSKLVALRNATPARGMRAYKFVVEVAPPGGKLNEPNLRKLKKSEDRPAGKKHNPAGYVARQLVARAGWVYSDFGTGAKRWVVSLSAPFKHDKRLQWGVEGQGATDDQALQRLRADAMNHGYDLPPSALLLVRRAIMHAVTTDSHHGEVHAGAKSNPAGKKHNPAVTSFKTADGYTFYLLPDGRVADSTDENSIDQSWADLRQFRDDMKADGIKFTVVKAKAARAPRSAGDRALTRAVAAERSKKSGFDAAIAAWNDANSHVRSPFDIEADAAAGREPKKNPKGADKPWALAKRSGFDDIVVSMHETREDAETALKKKARYRPEHGDTPQSVGYTIVKTGKGTPGKAYYSVISFDGKKQLRIHT